MGKRLTYGHPEPPRVRGRRWVEVGDGHFAEVDRADWDVVKPFRWFLNEKGIPTARYRQGDGSYTSVQLKMLIWGRRAEKGYAIKNLDGNPLNCTRKNVRMMTLTEARALDREVLGPPIRAPRPKNPRRLPRPAEEPKKPKRKFRLFED